MAAFGLLAAGIAHEVGNPLTAISSLVQLLERRNVDGYTQEKLGLVNGQLQRIQTTLRELVNFSRPASTERTRVDLKEILDEALNIAKYYRGANRVLANGRPSRRTAEPEDYTERRPGRQLLFHVPDELPLLLGVRDQLVQVFLNLILNAIDATGPAGRIEIAAEPCGDFVEVRISDDGIGITPEHAARLFQPYFTTKRHGTGLGLFVTRKLLADHGGTIALATPRERGTEFIVRLPVERTEPLPRAEPAAASA
jgi:signal transduction histidine kinase